MSQNKHDANGGDHRQQDENKRKITNEGRPDKGGTAGQSGGEEAKNRSSDPGSVQE